ncbi:DUF885 domain-containing protein [Nocardia cyriacigeorgica]|uniref:DUF885 domain-containing protein n=1 Tax=Nocardia cyriacigeorgica TaxID=135487 RepID=A0A5R8P7Z3_9NOCA|nr:DUF885 domain-containing protein [Nocardia cyriacigeorgica]
MRQYGGVGGELGVLADRYWDTVLAASPNLATLVGDHRFDDRVEDLSMSAEQGLTASFVALRERVSGLDSAVGSESENITRRLLLGELDRWIAHLRWRPSEMAWDHLEGVHTSLLTLVPQFTAPEPEHARALLGRFRQVGGLLDSAMNRFRHGVAAGRTPARVVIERSISQLDGYLASPLDRDPFATLAGPTGWSSETAWRVDLNEVARETVRPALRRYRDMLADELLPAARSEDRAGLCWLGDDGADIYARLLRHHTTLDDADPDRIHDLGRTQIARLREQYALLGERVFGTTDTSDLVQRMREDPGLRYRDGDQILTDARGCLENAAARAGDWFGRLPRSGCEIAAVPDFLAPDVPAAYYYPPAADGSRPGTYYVNQHAPADRCRFETAAVAYHEAIPGHHLQLALAAELDHLPRFQRESFANTAFVEGWGLYAELLADEMGLYTDDLDRLGMLTGDSLRSARLVVDTGIHAKGWTRDQAIDYMLANVPAGLTEITVEVDRYIAMPAQAVAYKIGQLEILRHRSIARERLGAGFDIAAFHDRILGSGSISLPVLAELATTVEPTRHIAARHPPAGPS